MTQIETAQHITDEFMDHKKTVFKVFFPGPHQSPFECCIVFDDFTCEIVNGLFAVNIKNGSIT